MKQRILVSSLLSLLFFFILFINLIYLESIPHVPDEVAYLFMAKMFALGHITFPIAYSGAFFDFFPGILSVTKGYWLFQYPFAHPLLLSVGVLLGNVNIIPPLIATISVFFLFRIAKIVYTIQTAWFIIILPFFSPFFLENSASFMSHTSAMLFVILALYALVLYRKKPQSLSLPFMAGISLGLLFNTRPLTAFIFILATASLILTTHQFSKKFLSLLVMSCGFFCLFTLWCLYNYVTTGEMFVSQYYVVNKDLFTFPFEKTFLENVFARMQNIHILGSNLFPMLFNLPSLVSISLLFVPIFYKKRFFWDYIFFIALFLLPIAYFFYNGTFLMYGPRFWYEMLPFIFLLTARSFAIFYSFLPKTTICVAILLGLYSFACLFSFLPTRDPDIFSPLSLKRLQGFNFTDARIRNTITAKKIHNAIIFVKECQGNWWCYGSVFSENNPTLTSDIIYAKDLGTANSLLMTEFPHRSYYNIDYYTLTIEPLSL